MKTDYFTILIITFFLLGSYSCKKEKTPLSTCEDLIDIFISAQTENLYPYRPGIKAIIFIDSLGQEYSFDLDIGGKQNFIYSQSNDGDQYSFERFFYGFFNEDLNFRISSQIHTNQNKLNCPEELILRDFISFGAKTNNFSIKGAVRNIEFPKDFSQKIEIPDPDTPSIEFMGTVYEEIFIGKVDSTQERVYYNLDHGIIGFQNPPLGISLKFKEIVY